MLHSLSKVDAVFTCRDPEMKIALHGQPVTRASIRAAAQPRSVNLNGRPIDPAYDARNKTISLRAIMDE